MSFRTKVRCETYHYYYPAKKQNTDGPSRSKCAGERGRSTVCRRTAASHRTRDCCIIGNDQAAAQQRINRTTAASDAVDPRSSGMLRKCRCFAHVGLLRAVRDHAKLTLGCELSDGPHDHPHSLSRPSTQAQQLSAHTQQAAPLAAELAAPRFQQGSYARSRRAELSFTRCRMGNRRHRIPSRRRRYRRPPGRGP